MKKQSGFTLIELMVVMAIIAILATAGLSAYSGYIKKARDTTRIADLSAINAIILGSMVTNGLPPVDAEDDLGPLVLAANNGQPLFDPLNSSGQVGSTLACINPADRSGDKVGCGYSYMTCDNGVGYILTTHFESESNVELYDQNASGMNTTSVLDTFDVADNGYDIGSCSQPYAYPVMIF